MAEPATIPDTMWAKVDSLLELEDREKQDARIDALVDELLASPVGKSPEAAGLAGYLLYLHSGRLASVSKQERVRTELRSALRSSDRTVVAEAMLYLGHNDYDVGLYAQATHQFDGLDVTALGPFLRLKALEMRVCCRIKTKSLGAALKDFHRLVAEADRADLADVCPLLLDSVIENDRSTLDAVQRDDLLELADRLDRIARFTSFRRATRRWKRPDQR